MWKMIAWVVRVLCVAGVARAESPCRGSEACAAEGRCTEREGLCRAVLDVDCRDSLACFAEGRCLAYEGACVAGGSPEIAAYEPSPRDGAMMGAGIAVSSLGLIAAVAGVVTMVTALDCFMGDLGYPHCEADDAQRDVGLGLVIGGILGGSAIGIPLAVIGGRKTRREDGSTPTLRVGATGATLSWTF